MKKTLISIVLFLIVVCLTIFGIIQSKKDTSIKGIILMKMLASKINNESKFIFGYLSEILPPIKYPILIKANIIPIIHVHIKFELPKYGDKILEATNSTIIPVAPAIKVVISNLYFFIFSPLTFVFIVFLLCFHQK